MIFIDIATQNYRSRSNLIFNNFKSSCIVAHKNFDFPSKILFSTFGIFNEDILFVIFLKIDNSPYIYFLKIA